MRDRGLIKKIHISGQKKAWSSTESYNLTALRNISVNGVIIKMVTQVISDFIPLTKRPTGTYPL